MCPRPVAHGLPHLCGPLGANVAGGYAMKRKRADNVNVREQDRFFRSKMTAERLKLAKERDHLLPIPVFCLLALLGDQVAGSLLRNVPTIERRMTAIPAP